ncbi:MAG: methyltransferase domain-containing protein [Endomicrobium sp.]|jgi:23S rRNA (guanine745-N1)-methyltransferase|nr:methyltransferase domain-containing protein [Endomicrobium sp.]
MEKKMFDGSLKNCVSMLMCPLCRGNFFAADKFIKCENGHAFDISRQGYVNFLNKPVKTGYGKKLFVSRRAVTLDGFFNPIAIAVSEIIAKHFCGAKNISIADFGCGEGSLFEKIVSLARLKTQITAACGIDISKDGISYGANMYKDISWIAADLANPPLKDKSADIILNVFSPANYSQFKRCLKKGGLAVKIVPQAQYLKEIRSAIGKPEYADENAKRLFYENFDRVSMERIFYRADIKDTLRKDFMQMTPLAWGCGAREEDVDFSDGLTVEASVLYAKV